jgi:RNA polymerase sigma-70 factor (ECF subfamily)
MMSTSVDLRERVERAQAGDVSAISELYDSYAGPLLRYILARVYERELAQDLTQEVFIRVIKGIAKFEYRDEKSFVGWLYTIASNVLTTHQRRRRFISTPLDAEHEAQADESQSETLRIFNRIALEEAMVQLTEDQQQVLVLRFFADMSNSEVAGLLRRSEGAVKAIQHRALQSLQKILGRDSDDALPPARPQAEPGPAPILSAPAAMRAVGQLKPRSGD